MSISRYFYKTPLQNEQNNTYELEDINDNTIQSILESRFISDSIYGLEQYSDGDYVEQYLITPSHDKHTLAEYTSKLDLKNERELIIYELSLSKSNFFPLDCTKFLDLLNEIAKINKFLVFTQILICKRADNWRETLINQYRDFLNGNDNPIDNKYLRSIQNKTLKIFSKIANFTIQRDPIEEIDNKILQQGYRMEVRLVLFKKNHQSKFENEMNKLFSKLKLFNSLYLEQLQPSEIISEIENRSFKSEANSIIFSQSEVASILCSKAIENEAEQVKVTPNNKNKLNIVRYISNNYFAEGVKLLPYVEKVNAEVNKELEKQIIGAFKRVKISNEPLKVTDVTRGARLQRIECKIPKDKNYDHIKKNLINIQAALGNEDVSLEIGNKPETVNFYVPCKNSEAIYLKSIIQSEEFQEFAQSNVLPIIIGEDEIGNKLFTCLSAIRHLLVAGTSGSGKSVFVNCILITLILYMNPDEIALYLIDPKTNEFNFYDGFPQVKEVIIDMNKASELLSKLTAEMESRYKILSKEGYRDIKGLNKSGKMKLPYIVCVIDEYADLVMTNPEVEDYIQRLGQKARAAGIHLIVATQRPSSDILDGSIKINLSARIGFKMETSSDYKTVFGTGIPFQPLGEGDGCARIERLPKNYQRFQSPLITLDDNKWKDLIEELKELYQNENIPQMELEEVVIEEPLDKLKRIITETGDTNINFLQQEMGIRRNDINDMRKQLLEEGWLVKNGRKYEIANQESDDE